jgi:hypothetical protein
MEPGAVSLITDRGMQDANALCLLSAHLCAGNMTLSFETIDYNGFSCTTSVATLLAGPVAGLPSRKKRAIPDVGGRP